MRVLFVTPSYFPIVGGSEVLTRNLSTKLNEIGVDSDIMTLNMDRKWYPVWRERVTNDGQATVFKEPALNPFPHLPNPLFSFFRMNVIPNPSFIRKLREYDIIHFVGEADLSMPLFANPVKKPKFFQCAGMFRHGGIYKYYMRDRAMFGTVFRKYFPRLADTFIISSSEERELLIDIGVRSENIIILPIGVDTDLFRIDDDKKADNLVLFVGRIERIKGLHILLDSLSYVKVPLQLVIIGSRWNADYAEQIEVEASSINKNGIHRVTFLGSLDQRDVVPWYQKATVVACPFLYETYSNVVREALACGTPVISTGRHLIENGSDGIFLVSKNPESFADGLNKLLGEREFQLKYAKEARKVAEEKLSWGSIVRSLVKLYESRLPD